MKKLVDAFLDLPLEPAILLLVAFVAIVVVVALIVSYVSFRAGRRYESRDKVLIVRHPSVFVSSSEAAQRANLARHGIEYL